ncbi:unnamed protein product [Rhizopus stolonifer]
MEKMMFEKKDVEKKNLEQQIPIEQSLSRELILFYKDTNHLKNNSEKEPGVPDRLLYSVEKIEPISKETNAFVEQDHLTLKPPIFPKASEEKFNPISKEVAEKTNVLFKEDSNIFNNSFSTASGKKLDPISKEAVRKANDLFKKEDINAPSFFTASEKMLDFISKEAAENTFVEQEYSTLKPLMFFTASGKKLDPISKESMEKAKTLFEEENHTVNPPSFSTASGKKLISVSKEAIEKANALLKEESVQKPDTSIAPIHPTLNRTLLGSQQNIRTKRSTPPTAFIPENNNKRPMHNKPFKLPSIRLNIPQHTIQNSRGPPVFDLTIPTKRGKLADFGKPQGYDRQSLLSENIPLDIIEMTSSSAKNYLFSNHWGSLQAQEAMINAGALPKNTPLKWVENHYQWIVWKLACQIRSFPHDFLSDWKPETVVHQLLYRHEREVNQGQRSVLKKIMEQDDTAAKNMILVISDIKEIKSPLAYDTSSKYQLQVSDGWYQMPVCIDSRMERAITKKRLKIGFKLSLCGAHLIHIPSVDGENTQALSISTNRCLPVAWDTRLGYHPKKCIIRNLASIFEDGGLVTLLDVVVCRKFPMFYTETMPGGSKLIRTAREEEKIRIELEEDRKEQTMERKVSGYFKMRICDYQPSQGWATVLLLNTNEMNHMDIEEGSRFKIFFVTPYCPKTKKYPGLHFKTTPMTRWEPAQVDKMPSSFRPRFISSCADIYQQDCLLDFDLAVLIMHTGPITPITFYKRKLWKQKLLVTDQSQALCQIELSLPFMPPHLTKGQLIGFVNLQFEYHDPKFNITSLKMKDESEIVSKGSHYMQRALRDLQTWTKGNKAIVSDIANRILTIV